MSGLGQFPRFVASFEDRFVHPDFPGASVKINWVGYRDRPWDTSPIRRGAPTSLLSLGGSFTFGVAVEAGQGVPLQSRRFKAAG